MSVTFRRTRRAAMLLLGMTVVAVAKASSSPGDGAWPARPIKVLVPYVAGGPVDNVTRMVMEAAAKSLKQPIIIENKPGANTQVATAQLARSAADGYTFGVVPAAYTTNLVLSDRLPYKSSDLAAVSHMVDIPLFLYTSATTPARNTKEFVAWAKQKSVNYASTGPGSTGHLLGEMLAMSAGLKGARVGYNGSAQLMPDLVSGRVDYIFDPASGGMPQVKAGKLKVLAVSLPLRCLCAPDVPTMTESGYPDIVQSSWIGLMAPASTPKPIVDRMSAEIAKVIRSPEMTQRLQALGFGPAGSTPTEFQALIERDRSAYAAIVRKAGISLER